MWFSLVLFFSSRTLQLASYCLWQFIRRFLFLMTLTVLKSTSQVLCSKYLKCDCNVFSSRPGCNYGAYWQKDHRDEIPFLSHHSKGTSYQHDLLMIIQIIWPRYGLLSFSTSHFTLLRYSRRKSLKELSAYALTKLHLFEGGAAKLSRILLSGKLVSSPSFIYPTNHLSVRIYRY